MGRGWDEVDGNTISSTSEQWGVFCNMVARNVYVVQLLPEVHLRAVPMFRPISDIDSEEFSDDYLLPPQADEEDEVER